MEAEVFHRVYPSEYHATFLNKGIRADGRKPGQARKIVLSDGNATRDSVGSVMLKQGNTCVIAIVQAQGVLVSENRSVVAEEHEREKGKDTPGLCECDVDVSALCSSKPRSNVVLKEESSRLSILLREYLHSILDLTCLCIQRDLLIWKLKINVTVIDNDGNLEAAVLLAAYSALKRTRLPRIIIKPVQIADSKRANDHLSSLRPERDQQACAIASKTESMPLKFQQELVLINVIYAHNQFIVDPTAEEEEIGSAKILFEFQKTNASMRKVTKPGGSSISPEQVSIALELAKMGLQDIIPSML